MGKALQLLDGQTGQRIVVEMGGILVHVDLEASADYLPEIFVIIRQCKFRQQQAMVLRLLCPQGNTLEDGKGIAE